MRHLNINAALKNETVVFFPTLVNTSYLKNVSELKEGNREEILSFLGQRPVHTVVMTSWILDNGVESELNRGKFYGYRNENGKLEGVALIGHCTLIEAHSEEAQIAFALQARTSTVNINLMMATGDSIEHFWQVYKGDATQPKHLFTEILFDIKFPLPLPKQSYELRLATKDELLLVAEAQGLIAFEETGRNPFEVDHERFLERVMRRIEQGRIWVVMEDGKLVFKADVIAKTDSVSYLEGIYTNPEMRGQGIGSSCLLQLSHILLRETPRLCLLSNVEFKHAHRAFQKAGFRVADSCKTIFV